MNDETPQRTADIPEGGYGSTLREAIRLLAEPEARPFATVLTHGTLSVEIFAPRGVDTQQPHARDELYVVVAGTGELTSGTSRRGCGPGDLLFVPAGMEHRFENFSDDFAVWAIFYGPEGGERPDDGGSQD